MTDKLLIVDGSSMLVTSYYGNLPRQILFEKDPEKKKSFYHLIMHNEEGQYTNAMFAMIRMLMKILKEQKPTHIAFAFDKTRNTFRREKYAEYKGNRSETPQPLKEQFVAMENLLENAGFKVFYDDRYEADDIAGSIAKKFEKTMPTYIITKDHDYLQLVNDYTRLWLVQIKQETATEIQSRYSNIYGFNVRDTAIPDKAIEITKEVCKSEYGVYPYQIPDLKGIHGDTSDNIPGVKGVSSAAAPLLEEYGTIEEIYKAIEECQDAKEEKELNKFWKEELQIKRSPLNALKSSKEIAFMSKDLATIRCDYPLDFEIDDLKININKDNLIKDFEKYGFKSLIDKIR